jgi:hypothetical protein
MVMTLITPDSLDLIGNDESALRRADSSGRRNTVFVV